MMGGRDWLQVLNPESDLLEVRATCISCGQPQIIVVPREAFRQWLEGQRLIQEAFPGLSVDQREIMISGECGPCFDALFPSED